MRLILERIKTSGGYNDIIRIFLRIRPFSEVQARVGF
jgi:hypothetical protein